MSRNAMTKDNFIGSRYLNSHSVWREAEWLVRLGGGGGGGGSSVSVNLARLLFRPTRPQFFNDL